MKTLLVLLIVIFCNTDNVASSISSILNVIWTRVKGFFTSLIWKIKILINRLLGRPITINQLPPNLGAARSAMDLKTKRAFMNILEESPEGSDATVLKSISFKSEPTALMTMPQLAKQHGKRIESHVVVSEDGYLLTLHRLMKPLDQPLSGKSFNPTVLLHHGLLGSSADWILLGPRKSLPYILSNLGYDVWMTNARGNYYSRGHVSKNINSLEYWKFSWQEMGKYDLPAVVDYIRKLKNTNMTMDFIGHSMGATALLVLLSTIPRYNKYFRIGILLAPLAYMSNIEGPLRIFASIAMNLPGESLKLLGDGEFFSSRKLPSWIVKKYCTGAIVYCSNPLLFLSGTIPQTDKWDATLLANIVYHVPAGGSTNTMIHYAYLIGTGKFKKFEEKTEFPLKKVTLPMALFSSSDDWLATIPDVLKLYFSISNPIENYIIRDKNFSHAEFVFGPEADVLIFNKVVHILEQGLSGTSAEQNEV